MLNLYPNYFISKGEAIDISDDEYYDDYEEAYDDHEEDYYDYEGAYDYYEYDQDHAEDYGLEAGNKFIILRMSAVPFVFDLTRTINIFVHFL